MRATALALTAPSQGPIPAPQVAALIEPSDYLESVCDHAAWCAAKIGATIKLAVVEPDVPPGGGGSELSGDEASLVKRALDRLSEDGAAAKPVDIQTRTLLACAVRMSNLADLLVVGRCGRGRPGRID